MVEFSLKTKISLLLRFMTLIIRIPWYTYCKSQQHYQQQSTLGELFHTCFVYSYVENMQTFYIHILLHVMVYPFDYFLKFPLKYLIVLVIKRWSENLFILYFFIIAYLYSLLPFLRFGRKEERSILCYLLQYLSIKFLMDDSEYTLSRPKLNKVSKHFKQLDLLKN